MVLPHGVDMWYDDDPIYDERYFRTLRRQTNDLLTEYEQTHDRAINSQDRTDKNRANEIRKQLEKRESELKLRKNRFTSKVLRENIDKLTTEIQACLYRLRLFPALLAITDGRDNGQNPQQIANATKSLRLLMLEPQRKAGVIEIQNTQPRPWHPPLVVSQTSAQQTVHSTDRPPNRSSTTQHSSVRVHGHSPNVSHLPIATRTNETRQSNTVARENTHISHTNPLPHLHGTDRDGDGDGNGEGDDASVTTFSSARSDITIVPELVDITSFDGENEHENLRKKYDKVIERKKKLNDHFNDKKKKYDDECRLLLGKMHSLSGIEGNDANAQIGEEGQADMEREFETVEGFERVNRTRSWVNSQESVHPSDSASVVSFLGLPSNNANQQNTQSPHTLPYTDSNHPTNTHSRRTNHDPPHHTQTNERADVSRTLADRRRTEGIQPQNHSNTNHQVESHPPQNHPNTHSNPQYHPQRPAQHMSTRQTYTVISQTRGENATATHILATECARLDTIPQSPRSHQNIPNDNIQHEYSNIERQRHNERQIAERQTNNQIQTNTENNNIQTNIHDKNSTRPKVRTYQQESHTQTKQRTQPRAHVNNQTETDRQSRHDSDIPFATSDISTQKRASYTNKSKNTQTKQSPPISPIHSPNLELPKPNNSRQAQPDPNSNRNGHTSNSYLPQQKHETKKEEAHNRSANNMDDFIGAMASSPARHSSLGGRKSPKISVDLNPDDENKGINNEGQFFNTDLLRFFAAKDARDFLQRNRLPEEQRFSGDSKVDFESVLLRFETITANSGIPARELIFELKHYFSGEAAKICELYEGRGNAEENLKDAINHLKLEFGYEARSIHNMINNIVCNGSVDRSKPTEFKALRIGLTTIYRKAKNAKRDSIFNNADTINRILVEKIPFCLNKWAIERSKKLTNMTPDSFEPEPQFTDFLKFLAYENKVSEELLAIHHSTKPTSGKKDNRLMTINTIFTDSQEFASNVKPPAKTKGGSQKRYNTKQTSSHADLNTPDTPAAATAAMVAAANFQQFPSAPLLPTPQRHPYTGGGGGYKPHPNGQQQQTGNRVNNWLQNNNQPKNNNYNMQRDGAQNIAATTRQASGENNWFCRTCNSTIYHELPQCKTFLNLDHEDKFTQIRANGACIRCLIRGHVVKDCTSTDYCQTCNGKYHHTLIHRKTNDKRQNKTENSKDETESLGDEDD